MLDFLKGLHKKTHMLRWYILEMYIWWLIKSVMVVTSTIRKWRYPELLDRRHNLEILHTTEYLQECLKSGKLKIDTKLTGKLTYHDPCYLSRLGGIVSEPRNVLCNIASDYVELKEKAFDTYCCGGGAMTEAVNRELWAKIGGERIRQVKMVNPEFLISACPFCRRSFTQANQRTGSHIQVLDITELVARQLKD